MTNPTDPAAMEAWRAAYAAVYGCEITHPAHMYGNAYPILQAYGDQREKAAVAEIVAWLRDQAERKLGHQPDPEQPGYDDHHYAARTGAYNALHLSALKIERLDHLTGGGE